MQSRRSQIETKRPSAVYVIKVGARYKIGVSLSPEQRIQNMQLPDNPEIILIFWTKKAGELEQALHRKYAAFRKRGEWFELEKPQLVEIAKVCEAWKKEVES